MPARYSLAELARERSLLERELAEARAATTAALGAGRPRDLAEAQAWQSLLAHAWAEAEGEAEARRQVGS
jgi:hypothetical protein